MGKTPLTRFLATQTLGHLREMKADARNEIEGARARLAELEADLARIEQAISEKAGGRRPSVPSAENRQSAQPGRSLKQSIVSLMGEQPGVTWTTQDVFDELLKRGLAPGGSKPLNTVGNRLIELAHRGEVHRVDRGAYALVQPHQIAAAQRLGFATGDGERN